MKMFLSEAKSLHLVITRINNNVAKQPGPTCDLNPSAGIPEEAALKL